LGTAFLRAAAVAGDRSELVADDVIAMLRAAIEGIKHRGKAEIGDKTLLDALVPAVDKMAADLAGGPARQRSCEARPRWPRAQPSRHAT